MLACARGLGGPTRGLRRFNSDSWLASFLNHERLGVPKNAATATDEGFPLDRMHRLLAALGDPHRSLRVVHVAGSKGKGSTVAMLVSALSAAGFRVGAYTSPHLAHLRERIRVDDPAGAAAAPSDAAPAGPSDPGASAALLPGVISPAAWHRLCSSSAAAVDAAQRKEGGALTHFEVVTALALRHFAESGVDCAVIETGLGGVRDATNVFGPEQLEAAVVTTLDRVRTQREHMEALGGTLTSVAQAKAGIMRRGRPALLAPQPLPEAASALSAAAAAAGAEWGYPSVRAVADTDTDTDTVGTASSRMGRVRLGGGGWPVAECTLRDDADGWTLPRVALRLLGPHQAGNAALAAATLRAVGRRGRDAAAAAAAGGKPPLIVPDSAMREGFSSAWLPGRFEVLFAPGGPGNSSSDSPADWGRKPGSGGAVVLDGAHSPGSAAALADTLRQVFPGSPIAVVVAMARDKDASGFFRALAAAGPAAVVAAEVEVAGGAARSAPAEALAQACREAAPSIPDVSAMPAAPPGKAGAAGAESLLAAAVGAARARVGSAGVVCVTGSLYAVAAARRDLRVVLAAAAAR